jgi:hypothetical protein
MSKEGIEDRIALLKAIIVIKERTIAEINFFYVLMGILIGVILTIIVYEGKL